MSRVDRRTRAGRVMRTVERDLTADLGGDLTAAQRLLVQSVAVKACRLALLADNLLCGDEISTDDHGALAWFNSMRNDLATLGLERRAKEITRRSKLEEHFSKPFEAEAAE